MLPIPTKPTGAQFKLVPAPLKSHQTCRTDIVAHWSRINGETSGRSRRTSGEPLSDARHPHLSMVRSYTVADFFTLGNGTCGTISIFLCLNYIAEGRNRYFWIAFILLFVALFCDIF